MADGVIQDIFLGLRTFFAANLTIADADVVIGFRDERGQTDSDRNYPAAALSLYDSGIDRKRRYGGFTHTFNNQQGSGNNITKDKVQNPIPVNLNFQLDVYALKHSEDSLLQEEVMQILGSHQQQMTTAAGRIVYLIPETFNTLDGIDGYSLWRKNYRFRVETWFKHPALAEQVNLVIQHKLQASFTPEVIDIN